jgi:hypothetical protein
MKISKARVKKLILETMNRLLKEEEEKTQQAGGEKSYKTHFQTATGPVAVLQMGLKRGGVPEADLKKDFQIWKKTGSYHLISKKDPDYNKIKKDAQCTSFSIKQSDIDEAKKKK